MMKLAQMTVLCAALFVGIIALGTSQLALAKHHHDNTQGFNTSPGSALGGQGQSSDWTLTVRPVNVNFGDTNIHIDVTGPFGAKLFDNIANSQNPQDSFNMAGSDFPSGYRYKVCISSTAIGFFLPHCVFFTHGSGDETVTINPS